MVSKLFCGIFLGDVDKVPTLLEEISVNKPNLVKGKGLILSTFITSLNINDLTLLFTFENLNHIIFEIDKTKNAWFFQEPDIHNGLFSQYENDIKNLSNDSITNTENIVETVIDIENLSEKEKDELLNMLLEKGLHDLTNDDKKILKILSK